MTKDVLITIRGVHTMDEEDNDNGDDRPGRLLPEKQETLYSL